MPKRRTTLRVRIPPYVTPRNAWRRELHSAISSAVAEQRVEYQEEDRLEVVVRFYFDKPLLELTDVDNRLKDILDALQGRAGGPKQRRELEAVVPNDRQVFRVTVEKAAPPKQSLGLGHLIVRRVARKARS